MEKMYIFHHQGMGDQFLCNGLVRHFAESNRIVTFARPLFKKNVEFMYRDNPNIEVKCMEVDDAKRFMQFLDKKHLIAGFTNEYIRKVDIEKSVKFDAMFYQMAGIPLEYKWSKFYFERDLEKEKEVFYNIVGLKDGEEFMFVCDDPSRNRIFKSKYLDKGIRIIRPNDFRDVGIMEFIYTIEKAKEVHVHSSGFSCMLDSMDFTHPNLFYHHYIGYNPEKTGLLPHYDHSIKKDKWVFLTE